MPSEIGVAAFRCGACLPASFVLETCALVGSLPALLALLRGLVRPAGPLLVGVRGVLTGVAHSPAHLLSHRLALACACLPLSFAQERARLCDLRPSHQFLASLACRGASCEHSRGRLASLTAAVGEERGTCIPGGGALGGPGLLGSRELELLATGWDQGAQSGPLAAG